MAEVKTVKILVSSENKKIDIVLKAKNLVNAFYEMQTHGFDLVSKQTRDERGAICSKCKYWRKYGNIGLGECGKCGCSKFKRFFKNQKCPIGKW